MTKSDKIIVAMLAAQCLCFIVGFIYVSVVIRAQRRQDVVITVNDMTVKNLP